jgi:FlaA1/EpsC-like NDP-sugar epimerase
MMGASKRIMEMFLLANSGKIPISTARFANVAFSDGSLLHGFRRRMEKDQPIAAPNDVRRYFVTGKEAGELCLLSGFSAETWEIFFPTLSPELNLVTFSSIAEKFLRAQGFEPLLCSSEEEARASVSSAKAAGKWPCYFFSSDTTGEKDFEEFYTENEKIDTERFASVGVVMNGYRASDSDLHAFLEGIERLEKAGRWNKKDILDCLLPPPTRFRSLRDREIPGWQDVTMIRFFDLFSLFSR